MNIYELVGVIIGDGHVLYNPSKNQYRLEIYGNSKEDWEYYEKIADFIESLTKRRPKIRKRYLRDDINGLILVTHNKGFVEYLINELGLPYGNKTYTVTIPRKFTDWKFSKDIIRGIFETDGSLYFSMIKGHKYPKYPRITIRSVSAPLINQLKNILNKRGFDVHTFKDSDKLNDKLYVSEYKKFNKWKKEIGFSHPKTISKILLREKLGHYIQKISYAERLKILSNSI